MHPCTMPRLAMAAAIALLPTVAGMWAAGGTDLSDPFDHFDLALSNYLPLLFPLLLGLLYAPHVTQETAHNFASPAQARLGRRRYVLGHARAAALWGFAAMGASIALAWIYTMYLARIVHG